MIKIYKKLESSLIQSICVKCNKNKQSYKSKDVLKRKRYRALCSSCHRALYNLGISHNRRYTIHKKKICDECGFIPEHLC